MVAVAIFLASGGLREHRIAGAAIAQAESTEGKQTGADTYGDTQCSCRSCEHEVCCKAPTGFAPLDEKCRGECETRKWTVKGVASCDKVQGCCP